MFRLETFGRLVLVDEAGAPQATQRRRLAILVVLASAGDRGLARDKLLALLWPESSTESARHTLEQLLYGLRRQIDREVFAGANPLALNPAVIESDLAAFGAALEHGDPERAVAVYRGPFLDGFHLGDAPEFERWVDTERTHLAGQCAAALELLAKRAGDQRDRPAATEWWRRLVEMDPYATGPTLNLMRVLAESGNRAAALDRARVHDALLREDLGVRPDPEIADFAARLRAGPEPDAGGGIAPPLLPQVPLVGELGVGSEPVASEPALQHLVSGAPVAPLSAAATGDQVSGPASPEMPAPSRRQLLVRRAVVLSVVALLAVGAAVRYRHVARLPTAAPKLDEAFIVVAPFRVTGVAATATLSEGLVDLLAARLTGEGGPQAMDPRATVVAWQRMTGRPGATADKAGLELARALGVGAVLEGEAVGTGGSAVTLSGRIRSARDGRVRARSSVSGATDSLPALLDRLAASLLALYAGEPEDRLPALGRRPLTAVRAYLAGRLAYRAGRYTAAVESYSRALQLEPRFGLAALELASAAGFQMQLRPVEPAVSTLAWEVEENDVWRSAVEAARKTEQDLDARDRSYLGMLAGVRFPQPTPALEQLLGWERATQAYPDDPDRWYHFGALLLDQGGAADVADARGRAAEAFGRARALDSGFVAPLAGLIEIAAFQRDSAGLTRLAPVYFARDSGGETADYVRWRIATVTGDQSTLRLLRSRFDSLSTASLARIQWTSQVDGIALEDADSAVAVLVRRAGNFAERQRACAQGFQLGVNRAHPRSAQRIIETVLRLDRRPNCDAPFLRFPYALYWDDDTAVAAGLATQWGQRTTQAPHLADSEDNLKKLMMLAQWRLWHGDSSVIVRAIFAMRNAVPTDSTESLWLRTRADVLAAILAAVKGSADARSRVARLDSLARLGCCEVSHWTDLVLVRLWERLGDRPAALRAARRARWYFAPEYLSAALREEGRLAALTGDRDGAVHAYRHFLALQSDPEPERRPVVERVRSELARLERAGFATEHH